MRAFRRSDPVLVPAFALTIVGSLLACASAEPSSVPSPAPIGMSDAGSIPARARDASTDADAAGAIARPPSSTYAPSPMDGGEACTLPPINAGPSVPLQRVASDPPSPTGGIISSGKYVLTSVDVFTGPSGATGPTGDWIARRCSFTETAYGCLEQEGDPSVDGGLSPPTPYGGGHIASGSMLAFSRSCPPASTWIRDYTATASELVLFTAISGATIRETMKKE